MPRKGYKTICVTDEVYCHIQGHAKQTNRTIPEYINHLLREENKKKSPTEMRR